MKNCVDDVRVAYPLFQTESGGSTPTSTLDLHIDVIDTLLAKRLNSIWHSRLPIYNTGFCLTARLCFGGHYGGLWYASAIWSNPVAQALPQLTWLELRRFAISQDAPKNTASRMLAVMKRIIKQKLPEVIKLISYQDCEAHKGIIYKAAGWHKGNFHSGGSWNRPNSKNTYNNKPRTRPDLNNCIGPKIRWEYDL